MVPMQRERRQLASRKASYMEFPLWARGEEDGSVDQDKPGAAPSRLIRRQKTQPVDRTVSNHDRDGHLSRLVRKGILAGFAKAVAGGANAVADGANAIAEHAQGAAAAGGGKGPGTAAAAIVAGGAKAVAGQADAVAGGANALAAADAGSSKDDDSDSHDGTDEDHDSDDEKGTTTDDKPTAVATEAPEKTDSPSLSSPHPRPSPTHVTPSVARLSHVVLPSQPPFQNNPEIPPQLAGSGSPTQTQVSRSSTSSAAHIRTTGVVPGGQHATSTILAGMADESLGSVTSPLATTSRSIKKDANTNPTAVPTITKSSRQATSTLYASEKQVYATGITEKYGENRYHDHGSLSAKEELVLISISSICGTIILGFLGWLIWRCYKRRQKRRRLSGNNSRQHKPFRQLQRSWESGKEMIKTALSRVLIVNKKLNSRDRGWTNLGKASPDPFSEKTHLAASRNQEGGPSTMSGVTVSAERDDNEGSKNVLPVPKPVDASTKPQAGNALATRQVPTNNRLSEMSSLSSGFGDGEFVWTVTGNTTTVTSGSTPEGTVLQPPPPAAQRASRGDASSRRETVFTEASEDSPPRFRNVNSWVRQQSGRVRRAQQRDKDPAPAVPVLPPEQDFALMMPDGEEPRRVDTTEVYTGTTTTVGLGDAKMKKGNDNDNENENENAIEGYGVAR